MHRTSIGAVLAELSVVGSTLEAPVEVSGVFPVDVDILIRMSGSVGPMS